MDLSNNIALQNKIEKQLKAELNKVALKYWKSCGVKLGQRQSINDLNIAFKLSINSKFYDPKNHDKLFVSHSCTMDSTENQYAVRLTFWAQPILASGKIGLPVRMAYVWIVTDNPQYVNNDPNNNKLTH